MKHTIIISCITFLLGIFCAHGFHTLIDQHPEKYYASNQQDGSNTATEAKTLYKEITTNQQTSSTIEIINPAPQKIMTENAIAATPPTQQPTTKIGDHLYEPIKATLDLLQSSKNDAERLTTLDRLFEATEADLINDPARELTLGDFFRKDKQLTDYIPQSIQCRTTTCKLELPTNDGAQVEQMMEALSAKILNQDLHASHIFLATNAAKGTTQLYVALVENNL